jgi:Tol biopolymer transport system component
VLVMVAGAAVAWFVTRHRHAPTQPIERQLTANPPEDWVSGAAISPDGKHVAYCDQTGLYLRSIDSGETHAVPLPEGLRDRVWGGVEWFPDGGKLLVGAPSHEGADIWVVTILGEAAPHLLYRNGNQPAISPDGQSLAFAGLDQNTIYKELWVGGINGESPRKLVTAEKDQRVFGPAWSPDGHWIAYYRNWKGGQGSLRSAIEVRAAGGGHAKTLASESSLPKSSSLLPQLSADACLRWSPDWRLVFCVSQAAESPSGQATYSLWNVAVEPRTGEAPSKPERLAEWSDLGPSNLTISADGKRLSFLKQRTWVDVYLAELGPDGGSLKPPRRLTLDNRGIRSLDSWTSDSQAILFSSDRNGKGEVFRQGLNESVGEAVVQGAEDSFNSGLSPDGSWILYVESTRAMPGAPPNPQRLMRRPVAGGLPEMVLEDPAGTSIDYWCAPKPGSQCVLGQKEGEEFVFYALDPVRGKGQQLGRIQASAFAGSASLSLDGSRLAFVNFDKDHGPIEVLTLSERSWHEVSLDPAWGDLQSIAWAADGKGFFVTSWLPDSFNLLHATLAGKVNPLLRNGHRQFMEDPRPSPDGKYLAYQAQTWDTNVWMLENF